MSEEAKRERADRLKKLRLELGFRTQEALADASDGRLERVTVNRVENKHNALTTLDLQRRFAETMGVPVQDFADYLDGNIPIAEVIRRRNAAAHGLGTPIDMPAVMFVSQLESRPDLAKVVKKFKRWKLSTVARALSDETYTRINETEPAVGWEAILDSIESGHFDATSGDAGEVLAATRHDIGRRKPLVPSPASKIRKERVK